MTHRIYRVSEQAELGVHLAVLKVPAVVMGGGRQSDRWHASTRPRDAFFQAQWQRACAALFC